MHPSNKAKLLLDKMVNPEEIAAGIVNIKKKRVRKRKKVDKATQTDEELFDLTKIVHCHMKEVGSEVISEVIEKELKDKISASRLFNLRNENAELKATILKWSKLLDTYQHDKKDDVVKTYSSDATLPDTDRQSQRTACFPQSHRAQQKELQADNDTQVDSIKTELHDASQVVINNALAKNPTTFYPNLPVPWVFENGAIYVPAPMLPYFPYYHNHSISKTILSPGVKKEQVPNQGFSLRNSPVTNMNMFKCNEPSSRSWTENKVNCTAKDCTPSLCTAKVNCMANSDYQTYPVQSRSNCHTTSTSVIRSCSNAELSRGKDKENVETIKKLKDMIKDKEHEVSHVETIKKLKDMMRVKRLPYPSHPYHPRSKLMYQTKSEED